MDNKAQRIKALKRRIRELAAAGLCQRDIARALGVSRHVVAYHAKVARIAMPREARWERRA